MKRSIIIAAVLLCFVPLGFKIAGADFSWWAAAAPAGLVVGAFLWVCWAVWSVTKK